jgi:hypothetical protein
MDKKSDLFRYIARLVDEGIDFDYWRIDDGGDAQRGLTFHGPEAQHGLTFRDPKAQHGTSRYFDKDGELLDAKDEV